ncbi:MAG: phosphatase PAP2 family protein [Candidatus Kapaibacterium sp.]
MIHASLHVLVAMVCSTIAWCDGSCDSLRGEAAVVRSVRSVSSLHSLSRSVSDALVPVSLALPVGLFAAGHLHDAQYDAASGVVLLAAEAATLGTTYLLKQTVRRPRPWRAHPDCISPGAYDDEFSFPSGHSSMATTMATYLSLRYPVWYVVTPTVLFAGYTWYARMNLGVHYPSDVIVGALLGAAIGYGAYRLTETVRSSIAPVLPLPQSPPDRGFPVVNLRIPL